MDKLGTDQQRGFKAQQLIDDPILQECFAKLKETYVTQWSATTAPEQDLREKLWMAARVVDVVRTHLGKIAGDGKLAAKELADMAKIAEPRKRFGVV